MLGWSAALLGVAAAGGSVLVMLSRVAAPGPRPLWPGLVHGSVAVAGFALLLAGLRGPARGEQQGAGSFGMVAAVLLGSALLLGIVLFVTGRRHAPSTLVLGLHSAFAVGGVVTLVAYLSA